MRSSTVAFGGTLAVLLTALLTACAGGDETLLAESQLRRLVLQPADLSQQWTLFDEGRQLRADAPPGVRADEARFGRQDGWKARYRRSGTQETKGPLVVESRADLFDAVSGARQDFDAAVDDLERTVAASHPIDEVELGDEARTLAFGGTEPGQSVTVTIVWREQNVVAAITANGFSGGLELAHVIELARKQQRRIERAMD